MSGILYVVATPIGNLSEMSPRAVETLRFVDLIAAEDTRNTLKLLNHFDIKTPQTSNHKFNEDKTVDRLVGELKEGKNIAVVSDAGTPCVNDPGFILVNRAAAEGITVLPISGPCAAIAALSASGLPADTFRFMGFFPREKKDALKITSLIKDAGKDLYIFYESPMRIEETLSVIKDELPDARIALFNDLTKAHERAYRGTPSEVFAEVSSNPNAKKGEYAMLLYYEPVEWENASDCEVSLSPEALLVDEIVKSGCSVKEAISKLSKDKSVPASKNELYAASLRLKELFG